MRNRRADELVPEHRQDGCNKVSAIPLGRLESRWLAEEPYMILIREKTYIGVSRAKWCYQKTVVESRGRFASDNGIALEAAAKRRAWMLFRYPALQPASAGLRGTGHDPRRLAPHGTLCVLPRVDDSPRCNRNGPNAVGIKSFRFDLSGAIAKITSATQPTRQFDERACNNKENQAS